MRSRQLVLIAGALLAQALVFHAHAQVAPAAPTEQPVSPAVSPAEPTTAAVVAEPAPPASPAPEALPVEPAAVTPAPPAADPAPTEIIGDPVVVDVAVHSDTEQSAVSVAPQAEPAEAEQDPNAWMLQHRRFSTREGTTGGLWIEEPSSGMPGAVRLQLALDVSPEDDFAETGNDIGRTDKAVTVSWTALPLLEVYGTLEDRSTSFEAPQADSIYAQGSTLGFKVFKSLEDIWSFGGGLRFGFNNGPGSSSPLLKATNVELRAGASADLQDAPVKIPLIARFNASYMFDNSAALVEDEENARYAALEASNGGAALPRNETRNLISRVERYAFDLNRVDRLTLGLGVEAPLSIGRDASLHPLLEYRVGVPINRQEFDCAIVRGTPNDGDAASGDDCLATAGIAAWPMNLALGMRVVPPVRGVTFLVALDLGLTGTDTFVRELSPNAPFALTFALGYDYDARE